MARDEHMTLVLQFIPMSSERRLQTGNNPVGGGWARCAGPAAGAPATGNGSFGGGMDTGIGNEIKAEGCNPDHDPLRQ